MNGEHCEKVVRVHNNETWFADVPADVPWVTGEDVAWDVSPFLEGEDLPQAWKDEKREHIVLHGEKVCNEGRFTLLSYGGLLAKVGRLPPEVHLVRVRLTRG